MFVEHIASNITTQTVMQEYFGFFLMMHSFIRPWCLSADLRYILGQLAITIIG